MLHLQPISIQHGMRMTDGGLPCELVIRSNVRLSPWDMRKWVSIMEFAQNEEEFEWFLAQLDGVRSVLEIGSRFGESLYRIGKHLPVPSTLLGVDLPNADDNPLDSERALLIKCEEITQMGHKCYVLLGDSHDPKVIAAIQKRGPFDLVFIDGDHSEQGVWQDWENFGPLGKMVAFHDIAVPPPCYVSGLWGDLQKRYKTREYAAKKSGLGIGIVYRESYEG